MNLVIFDLDGTINQTALYAVEATKKALLDLNAPHIDEQQIRSLFGARPADYVKIYFPKGDESVFQEFLKLEAHYENELMDRYAKAFDGVENSIRSLKNDGFHLAVCSNSSTRYITRVLKTIGLFHFFDEIQPLMAGMTKKDTLKQLLDRTRPQKAVMIGDRIYDKEAAHANQIPFIGCLYGYSPQEVLDADRTVLNGSELYSAVWSLICESKT
jgi:phosphoglycolate phosphatase